MQAIDEVVPFDRIERAHFRIPLHEGASISLLHELGRVVDVRYTEQYCEVDAEVPASLRQRLGQFAR
jgi:hypothetical protein